MRTLVRQNNRLAVAELPPQRRTIYTVEGVFRVPTPYTVFAARFSTDVPILQVFWRDEPVTRPDDPLYQTWFANVTPSGYVCLKLPPTDGGLPDDPVAALKTLVAKFYSSQFNWDEIGQINHRMARENTATGYYRAWQNCGTPKCDRQVATLRMFVRGDADFVGKTTVQ